MDMQSLLSFEHYEENLFDWQEVWPMESVPENILELPANNSWQAIDTVLIHESAQSLEKEEIPGKLLEDEPEPAVSSQSKEVRHSKSAKKKRKPPLYTRDPSNLGNSQDKRRSYKKSMACKLYRDRLKSEKFNLERMNEEKDVLIKKLNENIEHLQQDIVSKDEEIQNLKNIISREETFYQQLE